MDEPATGKLLGTAGEGPLPSHIRAEDSHITVFCCLRLRVRVRVRVRVRGSERPSTVNRLRREKERKGMTFAAG